MSSKGVTGLLLVLGSKSSSSSTDTLSKASLPLLLLLLPTAPLTGVFTAWTGEHLAVLLLTAGAAALRSFNAGLGFKLLRGNTLQPPAKQCSKLRPLPALLFVHTSATLLCLYLRALQYCSYVLPPEEQADVLAVITAAFKSRRRAAAADAVYLRA